MTRPVKGRCSSCGGSDPDPLFWWLCRPCRRRIEGKPVDLDADEVNYGHGGRISWDESSDYAPHVYKWLYSGRAPINRGVE